MNWARAKMLSVFLAATLLALTLASQAPAAPAARRGGTLRIANIGEPPTLDMSATTVGVTSNHRHCHLRDAVRLRRELAAPAHAGGVPHVSPTG